MSKIDPELERRFDEVQNNHFKHLGEVYERMRSFEERIESIVSEYRKTVNSAISLLSKEFIEFQQTQQEERTRRQKRNDIKDMVIAGIGCLVFVSICVVIGVLIAFVIRVWYYQ